MQFANLLDSLHLKLREVNKMEDATYQFKQLTTNEERVIFVLKIMSTYSIIPPDIKRIKNATEAKIFRDEGNKIFVQKQINRDHCVHAFELYTKSIAFSPCLSTELALAYGNRSAVLFKMCKYTECICDIERALVLNYPEHLRAKLYIRKAECLMLLEDPMAQKVFDEIQEFLNTTTLEGENRGKFERQLGRLRMGLKQAKQKKPEKKETTRCQELNSRNPEVPCASDAISVKYTEELGRHVIALRKIYPGEVVTIEKPYSILLRTSMIYTHCANCFRTHWSGIPCDHCVYAIYCSEKCKSEHWKMCHDIECSVFGHLIELECLYLDLFSLRIAIQAVREVNDMNDLRDETKELDQWSDPRTAGFAKDGKLHSDKYRGVYGLLTNLEKRSVSNVFRRVFDACCILYYVATQTTFFGCILNNDPAEWTRNKDLTFVGSLIFQHQMSIPTNMHDFAEVRGLDSQSYAVGALPFCSFLNHGCDSNVSRYNNINHEMVIYAAHTIMEGEQLLCNYGQHYALTPKKQRQEMLRQQYYFDCNCIACEENWPLYFSLESYTSFYIDPLAKQMIREASEKLMVYICLAVLGDASNVPNIEEDLVRIVAVLYKYASIPCKELTDAMETLQRVYDFKYSINCEIPDIS